MVFPVNEAKHIKKMFKSESFPISKKIVVFRPAPSKFNKFIKKKILYVCKKINEFFKLKIVMDALILCGGYGKRLGKITKRIPKPFLTINNKPFIQYIINNLVDLKFQKFIYYVVINQIFFLEST